MSFPWDDKSNVQLTNLHEQGLSFTEIAAEMGCTRNAAIGRAHRLHLPMREAVVVRKPKPPPLKLVVTKPATKPATKPVTVIKKKRRKKMAEGEEYRCLIWDLTDTMCRFPLWENMLSYGDRFYCGAPEAELSGGRPYCKKHTGICIGSKYNR